MKKLLILLFYFITTLYSTNIFAQYEEQRFNVSGFMDFAVIKMNFSENSPVSAIPYINNNVQYVQNNLNLYFNFKIEDGWRAFTEVRLLYYPTGNLERRAHQIDTNGDGVPDISVSPISHTGTMQPNGTEIYYSNTDGQDPMYSPLQYGSLYLERAYIECSKLNYLSFRLGRFFTPFGIWSNDHSSAAVTSARFPMFVLPTRFASYGMPSKQTGMEAFGDISISSTILQYAVYTGNGVSNAEATGDQLDNNKSIGAFLNIKLPSIHDIYVEFGGSGYRGKKVLLTSTWAVADLSAMAEADVDGNEITYYTLYDDPNNQIFSAKQMETNALAHFKVTAMNLPLEGTLVIQCEYMRQWINPDKDDRIQDPGFTVLDSIFGTHYNKLLQKNYINDMFYVQAEYQFFGQYTPYFRYEYFKSTTLVPFQLLEFQKQVCYVGGINYKASPRIIFKAEYSRNILTIPFITSKGEADNNHDLYIAQLTVAF